MIAAQFEKKEVSCLKIQCFLEERLDGFYNALCCV